jgi:hypothetical protein
VRLNQLRLVVVLLHSFKDACGSSQAGIEDFHVIRLLVDDRERSRAALGPAASCSPSRSDAAANEADVLRDTLRDLAAHQTFGICRTMHLFKKEGS